MYNISNGLLAIFIVVLFRILTMLTQSVWLI